MFFGIPWNGRIFSRNAKCYEELSEIIKVNNSKWNLIRRGVGEFYKPIVQIHKGGNFQDNCGKVGILGISHCIVFY